MKLDFPGESMNLTHHGLCDLSVESLRKRRPLSSLISVIENGPSLSGQTLEKLAWYFCLGYMSMLCEGTDTVLFLKERKTANPSSCILQTSV